MEITWNYILHTAPDIIRNILEGLKDHQENPAYHGESNAYEHIKIVTERLLKTGDMDLVMAAVMHDLGKLSTAEKSDEGPWNSSHGHENVSSQLVMRYKDWIQQMGANPYVVNEIVKNHMKIKFDAISKKDKDKLERYTIFQKLTQFMNADNMNRKWDLDEGLNLPKIKQSGDIKFGRVLVHFILLQPIEKYQIKYPLKLTYKIDGEDFPETMEDPEFDDMMKILKPEFDNNIRPYFESRGYHLWTY